ncbi:MAG: acyltransferase [Rhizomicrobium sp.]
MPTVPASRSPAGASAALSLFRVSLALMVMLEHLSASVPPQTGRLAVEAFFCISGFLITMVASGRYAGRPAAFLANRFLRIYPTYWACLAVGFAVVVLVPGSVAIHPSLVMPSTAADWIANLGVFGLTQQTMSRMLPAAWSLHTELWFYIVIGLVTAIRPRASLAMLAVSLAFSAYCAFWWGPVDFYGTPLGNADAFFIGSVVFQHRAQLAPRRPLLIAAIALAAFEGLAWGPYLPTQAVSEFLGAPVTGVLLLGLWNADLDTVLGRWKEACNTLGRLSYPLFLLHWPLGALVASAAGLAQGWALFALAGALSVAVAVVVLWCIEEPLVRLRAQIRSSRPDREFGESMQAISD